MTDLVGRCCACNALVTRLPGRDWPTVCPLCRTRAMCIDYLHSPLELHGAALHAMAHGQPEQAAHYSAELASVLRERRRLTTRMLQALDAYWLHCDGLPDASRPRGRYTAEDWWGRFERYRSELEALVRA